jgi:riboflavin synthase
VFTGLVEDMGVVFRVTPGVDATALSVKPGRIVAAELILGESIAIDGTCLTVTALEGEGFQVLASLETLARTTLGALRPGDRVNLERALRPTDRLGGHIVAGHVDGVAEICSRAPLGAAVDVEFRTPAALLRYVVEKGSVAVDGISLTVNRVSEYAFGVALIPHTLSATTLGDKPVGAKVNLEVDVVAKYVEKLVQERRLP